VRRSCAIGVTLAVLLLTGCGSDAGSSTAPAPKPKPTTAANPTATVKPTTGRAKFTGVHRGNYDDAKATCSVFSRARVAHDLGLDRSANVVDIAQKFSEGYRPAFRQAVFEGCLAGLKG
jgi:hypothetical protein